MAEQQPELLARGQGLPPAGAWSERADLQVQKMEQTIEQDLAKAMIGLREQFRQHPKFHTGGGTESDAAALTDFRSEAAAARDEMLDGLSRLRRELEVQRLQQTSSLVGPDAGGSGSRAQQQATEAAFVAELRHGLASQQSALQELRRDFTAQQEFSKRYSTFLDQEVQRLTGELELVRDQRLPQQACNGDAGVLRQELQAVLERLDRLELLYRKSAEERTAVSRCLHLVSEMDARIHGLAGGAQEAELASLRGEVRRLSEAVAEQKQPPDLERTREELSEEELSCLRERRRSQPAPALDTAELARRVDEVHQAASASYQEVAEGLMLEIEARQRQVTELRRHIAEELPTLVDNAMKALRMDIASRCRELGEELRGRFEVVEADIRFMSGCRRADGGLAVVGAVRPPKDDIAARVEAIEAGVQRNLAAMGAAAGEAEEAAGAREAAPAAAEAQAGVVKRAQSLISRNLKESLEQLVDKVNRTLKQGPDGGPPGESPAVPPRPASERAAWAAHQQPQLGCHGRGNSPGRQVRPFDISGVHGSSPSAGGSVAFSSVCHEPQALHMLAEGQVLTRPASAVYPVGQEKALVAYPVPSVGAPPPPIVVSHSPVYLGSSTPMVTTSNPMLRLSYKPPVTTASSTTLWVMPTATQSSESTAPGSSFDQTAALGTGDSKDTFRRCLQELREENKALREGLKAAPFCEAEALAPQAWVPSSGALAQVGATAPFLRPCGGSIQLTPGMSYRTLSPAQRKHSGATSRRSYSPICVPGLQRVTSPAPRQQ